MYHQRFAVSIIVSLISELRSPFNHARRRKAQTFPDESGRYLTRCNSLFFLSSRCEVFTRAYALGQMHLLHSPSLGLKHIMMHLVCLCSFAPFCLIANTFLQTDYDSKYHTIAFFPPPPFLMLRTLHLLSTINLSKTAPSMII